MIVGWLVLNCVDLDVGYTINFNTVEIIGIVIAIQLQASHPATGKSSN